jgi:hypothetical protein
MYQVDMYYTIKTLLSQGKSIRESASVWNVSQDHFQVKTALENGNDRPAGQVRTKAHDGHKDVISIYLEDGLTALLIHRRITTEKGLEIFYPNVNAFISTLSL